jgi:hypothetical protein
MEELSDLTSQQLEAEVAVVAEEAAEAAVIEEVEAVASAVAEVAAEASVIEEEEEAVEAVASVEAEVVVIEEEEADPSHQDQEWLSVKETPKHYEHEKRG